jgi:hypothetical protein
MLGVYERIIRDESRVRYHYVLIDFFCRPIGGVLRAASDAADVDWFNREELPGLNLAYDASDVIAKCLDLFLSRHKSTGSPVSGSTT